jgi:hypothetical protein
VSRPKNDKPRFGDPDEVTPSTPVDEPAWDEPTPPALPTPQPSTGSFPKAELSTRPALPPVETNRNLRKVVRRPAKAWLRAKLTRRVTLVLSAVGSLGLVLVLMLVFRSSTPKDPSRPVPISKTHLPLPKERPPPPSKRFDVTPTIAAPSAPPRPPLSMELTFDAGAGLLIGRRTVPASIVRIETDPTTSISWNGEQFGWQPTLITMPVGQNTITVENKELNLKKTISITAAETEKTFLRFEFSKGWLSIDRPASSKVSVEGLKVTQRAILLWEGRHRVDCIFRNGQKASKFVDVVRGETAEVFFDDPLPQE